MKRTPKTPFKDKALLISEISKFLKKYNTVVRGHTDRISDFFEMGVYNSVVKFYEKNGFKISCEGLVDGKFRYKLSPAGYAENFSYFVVQKEYQYGKSRKRFEFEIHHNIAIESAHEAGIFVTPDVSVIARGAISELNDPRYFFSGNRKYCFVKNKNLQTFFEVKNFNPFPELICNFTGLVYELKHDTFSQKPSLKRPYHLAPSLVLSGGGNFHMRQLRDSITKRFRINIIYGLFYRSSQIYSKYYARYLKKIGSI